MKDEMLGKLPRVTEFKNGKTVETVSDWEERRKEIIENTIALEYGGMPPEPERFCVEPLDIRPAGSVSAYRIHCGTKESDFTFCFTVHRCVGNRVSPVIITGDAIYTQNMNDEVIAEANRRGFTVVKFNRTELAPDFRDDKREYGINALWKDLKFSAISAWAWGYQRVVDALFTLDYIDKDNIAVTGHSRGGKTVLLAGALDERIKFINPNGSGCHGCGCYRYVQYNENKIYEDERCERLSDLFSVVPYWMGEGMKKYIGKEDEIPHDMHFIKSLIAPRYLLETNGYGDIWSNPKGSYLTFLAAREVWKLYGKEDNCATWYRFGGHAQGKGDFNALFDFIEAALSGARLPEAFRRKPYDDIEVE